MSRIRLTWNNASTTIVEQRVYRSISPLDFDDMPAPLAVLPRRSREYLDSTIEDGLAYYYAVSSVLPDYSELISEEIKVEAVEATDPHWDKVVSLLHFDGDLADQKGRVFTISGNLTYSQGIHGESINTELGYILAGNAAWNNLSYGQGDFTVEMFINRQGSVAGSAIFCHEFLRYESFPIAIAFGKVGTITNINEIYFGMFNGTSWVGANSTWTPETGIWHHIAASRVGDLYLLFADGVLVSSFSSTIVAVPSRNVYIGRRWDAAPSGSTNFNGYIDEFRITKGVARYTENFTPPTKPFPNN